MILEPLLTIQEAARILNVAKRSLYNLMARGELRFIKVGSVRRIEPSALEEYKSMHMYGPRPKVSSKEWQAELPC